MPTSKDDAEPQPPGRAPGQATDGLPAAPPPGRIEPRPRHLARGARARAGEEHDEYDDPDLGGEA